MLYKFIVTLNNKALLRLDMKSKMIVALMVMANLALASSLSFADEQVDSNVKVIPKNFIGKWAGLHSTDNKLTKAVLKDLCENGGEQDTSYFVTFNSDRQRVTNVAFWEDLYTEYPVTYSKYSNTHIAGQTLVISFEMGSDDWLATKNFSKFEYRLSGDKLYNGSGDQVIEMMRCD